MPRIGNVLQMRYERKMKQELYRKQLLEKKNDPPILCNVKREKPEFTERIIIKPRIEPDGASSESVYSLEEKPTRATMVESFSCSAEENSSYPEHDHINFVDHTSNMTFSQHDRNHLDDDEEFNDDDFDYESSKENDAARGNTFLDLVQEADGENQYSGFDKSQYYTSYEENDENNIAGEIMADQRANQPEVIEFVDSEDGKVFSITPRPGAKFRDTNIKVLDSMSNGDESHTLNTNIEALNYVPSLSSDNDSTSDQINDPANFQHDDVTYHNQNLDRFRDLQVHIEGGDNESYNYNDTGRDGCSEVHDGGIHTEEEFIDFNEQGDEFDENNEERVEVYDDFYEENEIGIITAPIPQGNSELYDCDDGEMYDPNNDLDIQAQSYDVEEAFFAQVRSEHSRNNEQQIPSDHQKDTIGGLSQSEQWRNLQEVVHSNHPQTATHQLEGPCLSDSDENSSWEEGSFGTGASRTMSRIDNLCDDEEDENNNNDDGSIYAGTFDETEYCSDDDDTYVDHGGDRPFVRVLKKIRDMNVGNQRSDGVSSDEESADEDFDETKKSREKQKRRGRSAQRSGTLFDRLGEIGMDILNDTIDHAEQEALSPRRRHISQNQGGTIINTFADLFSCG